MHRACTVTCIALVTFLAAVPLGAQPLTFSRADFPSVDGARGIASADFDRNGWPDVAHANGTRGTVTIVLNSDGRLTRARDVTVGRGPFDLIVADFNRDGTSDLAVTNADSNSLSVLWGRGDGTFRTTTMTAPANPRGIATADLNMDGWLDLAVTGYMDRSVAILVGSARGFTSGARYVLTGARPQGVAAADLNRDGFVDLAIAHDAASSVSVLFGQGASGFVERVLGGPAPMNVITSADINGDGSLDVAAASSSANRVAVYLGSFDGPSYSQSFAAGASPRDIVAADIDQNGRMDLLTADRSGNTVTVLPGSGTSSIFGTALRVGAGGGSRALVVHDFDMDGRPDIVTGNQSAAVVTLLTNTTSFAPAANVFTTRRVGTSSNLFGGSSVAVADFDHDGRPDVATQSSDFQNAAVLIALGSGEQLRLPAPPYVNHFWVRDLNRDGHDDVLALVDYGTSYIRTFLGDGRGDFTSLDAGLQPSSWRGYDLADVNADGVADLVFIEYAFATDQSALTTALGRGDGTFELTATTTLAGNAVLAGVGDLDRDARPDLLVRRLTSDEVQVWTGDGEGGYVAGQTLKVEVGDGFYDAHVADFNRDGWPDVVVSAEYSAGVLLGSASGLAWHGTAIEVPFNEWLSQAALADVDLDGNIDIVYSATFVAFGNGDGSFRPLRFDFEGSGVAVADFTEDGLPDILYADTIGSVTVLVNQRRGGNRPPTVSAGIDFTISYSAQFQEEGFTYVANAQDPDLHGVTYEWRDGEGRIISTSRIVQLFSPYKLPGSYTLTVTVWDGRGGMATDDVIVTIAPVKEIVIHAAFAWGIGWNWVADSTAASEVRVHDPNRRAPKVLAPDPSPERYVTIPFIADPTQTYKLWVRLKADGNTYSNDSIWVQISGAVDMNGRSYEPNTSSGLIVNLEECDACGVSGWGWEDDAWGAVDRHGARLRFPKGGYQFIRIQTREDGVSFDQVVLSAEKYVDRRPGRAKDDTTILPFTFVPD